jgi:hypothetical protein
MPKKAAGRGLFDPRVATRSDVIDFEKTVIQRIRDRRSRRRRDFLCGVGSWRRGRVGFDGKRSPGSSPPPAVETGRSGAEGLVIARLQW